VGACALATTANTVLFQSLLGAQPVATVPRWILLSAIAFLPVIGAVIWLIVKAALKTVDAPLSTPRPAS